MESVQSLLDSGAPGATSASVPSAPPQVGAFPWLAVATLVMGIGQMIYNGYQTKKQNAIDDRRLQQQRDWQLEDWDRQNDYNSPQSVMSRMAAAGLNPDLLVGGNNSDARMPDRGSAPAANAAPAMDVSMFNQAIQSRLNERLTESQISLNEANARTMLANAGLGDEAEDGLSVRRFKSDEKQREFENGLQKVLADSKIKVDDATVQKLSTEVLKIAEETKYQKLVNETYMERFKSEMDMLVSQKKLNAAKAAQLYASINEMNALLGEKKRLMAAQAGIAESQLSDIQNQKAVEEAISGMVSELTGGRINSDVAQGVLKFLGNTLGDVTKIGGELLKIAKWF